MKDPKEEDLEKIMIDGRTIIPRSGLILLGTVKGLVSESDLVARAIKKHSPQGICLHISPEEMDGLGSVISGKVKTTPMSSYEMVYAKRLSNFGEVQVPSPSLVKAYNMGKKKGIDLHPLDMDDETYTDVYTETIGGISMIRASMRLRSINRKKFDKENIETFISQWEKAVNGTKAFRELESKREEYMADRILQISRSTKPILCILELERLKGIALHL